MSTARLDPTGAAGLVETLPEDELRLRRELAACYRLIAHFGMTDLIFNHISVRLPNTDGHFLINPYGLMYEEITASNLVKIDGVGVLVEPSEFGVNPAGFVIHGAIHAARPDAHCVLHTHTRAGCAVAAQAHGLLPLNQMSLEFYEDVAYHDYEGIALDTAERERLVADLGAKSVMILRNHGLLTVGATPKQAFLRMFYLERACEIQVSAMAGDAPLVFPSEEVCVRTRQQFAAPDRPSSDSAFTDPDAVDLTWAALLRMLDRIDPTYQA
jgi:ribulose-5-phosphate 4-epimerase/fuculose-1-phosphate aldolase